MTKKVSFNFRHSMDMPPIQISPIAKNHNILGLGYQIAQPVRLAEIAFPPPHSSSHKWIPQKNSFSPPAIETDKMPSMLRDVTTCALAALLACAAGTSGCRRQDTAAPPCCEKAATQPASAPRGESCTERIVRAARRETARWLADPAAWPELRRRLRAAAVAGAHDFDADPRAHLAAGNRALAAGRAELAADCFRRAVQRDARNLDALKALATALSQLDRYADAAETYERICALAPTDAQSRFNLATVCVYLGRFPQAENAYLTVLEQDDTHRQARFNLAALYQVQGKLTAARDAWRILLADEPDNADAWGQLAQVLSDLGDASGAADACGQVARLEPRNVSSWLNLAAAAQAAGRYGRAAVALERAAALAPQDAAIWTRMSDLHMDLYRATDEGRFLQSAADAARRSLRLDDNQPEIRRRLEQCQALLARQNFPQNTPQTAPKTPAKKP